MDFKRGKLYKCPEFSLMIYSEEEVAAAAPMSPRDIAASGTSLGDPLAWTNFWSKRLNRQVHFSDRGEIFMFLERNGHYLRVLFGDKQGWIIFREELNIEKAKNKIQTTV